MADNNIEKIYQEHSRRIFLYIFSLCHDKHVAEDLAQETFVKAIVSLPKDCASVLPWLYKVASNLTYDYFREKNRYSDIEEKNHLIDFSFTDRLIVAEEYQLLYRCIQKLEENERRVITLHYFSGFKQYEIAAITGFSYSAVRVIASRAREKLKKLMEEEQG
ncbi:MAG: RNA polymerase sigma factor [Clostridia bacterium]|nr:RNA polymerase sigma factor [Clostridia bacterium]